QSAGRSLYDARSFELARRCFNRALLEPAPADQRAGLLLDLTGAELALELPSAVGRFRRALKLGGVDPVRAARTAVRLVGQLSEAALDTETVQALQAAAERLGDEHGDLAVEVQVALALVASPEAAGHLQLPGARPDGGGPGSGRARGERLGHA